MNKQHYILKFINFLKKYNLYDEAIYNYLIKNTTFVDYKSDKDFIGCFYKLDKANNVIKINLCIPFLENDVTISITTHEYIHGYLLYKNIGYPYTPEITDEVIPMLFEQLYYLENNTLEMKTHLEETKNNIIKGNRINHKLGILMQQELLSFQQYDVDTLKEYVNKLYKKYTHTLKK